MSSILHDAWERAKANTRTLDDCPGPHDFVDDTPEKKFDKRYRCTKCGGHVESLHRFWYERGLAHGRGASGAPC